MAEFLVKAIDATHKDPDKDRQGCYKRGDVVVVMPDGHKWGKEEHPKTTTHSPPKFFIVKIPDISIELARKYIEPEMDFTNPDEPVVSRRRKFQLLADDIPQALKNKVLSGGEITVNWEQVKDYIKNKLTGVTEQWPLKS